MLARLAAKICQLIDTLSVSPTASIQFGAGLCRRGAIVGKASHLLDCSCAASDVLSEEGIMKSTIVHAPIKPSAPGPEILKALRLAEAAMQRLHYAGSLRPADQGSASSRDLFAYLSESEKAAFFAQCSERHVPQHQTVFSQGRKHTTFLIKEGLVRTFYVSPSGKEITLAYWSAGEMIGGPYFFDDQRKNIWSAQAAENSVVLAIDGAQLQQLARRMPALAMFLIESLSFKLHWVSLLLQTLGTEFVHCRL